jgi:hypothetical protein
LARERVWERELALATVQALALAREREMALARESALARALGSAMGPALEPEWARVLGEATDCPSQARRSAQSRTCRPLRRPTAIAAQQGSERRPASCCGAAGPLHLAVLAHRTDRPREPQRLSRARASSARRREIARSGASYMCLCAYSTAASHSCAPCGGVAVQETSYVPAALTWRTATAH